jgi:hypothetical protein
MSVPVNTYITSETIERDSRYGLTRYTVADTDKIVAAYNELNLAATVTEAMELAAMTWLAVYAPNAGDIFAGYEVQSACELHALMVNEGFGFNSASKSGGCETYPLSVWKKWAKDHKQYQAKLQAAYDYAREDMVSQATNVNWWAA